MTRMDRYADNNTTEKSRSTINQDLYQDVYNNPKYTSITDVTNSNAYEINSQADGTYSRENYQKMKKYQGDEQLPKIKKELDDFNHLYHMNEKKVYDINSVLEDARKNKAKDDLEEKRKLKYTSYNILAGINLEELQKYREEKAKRQATPEEENMRELTDTIVSKTLAGEMDKDETVDLLCDLMATSALDTVASSKELGDKIKDTDTTPIILDVEDDEDDEEEEEEVDENLNDTTKLDKDLIKQIYDNQDTGGDISGVDKDFYTKSMDLSEEDFDMSDDFKDKKLPVAVKILLIIIVLALVLATAYFIYQKIV